MTTKRWMLLVAGLVLPVACGNPVPFFRVTLPDTDGGGDDVQPGAGGATAQGSGGFRFQGLGGINGFGGTTTSTTGAGGGAAGLGGAPGAGGALGTGGAAGLGGATGAGGALGTGGAAGLGGATGAGGALGTGGTSTGAGGAPIDLAQYDFESTAQGWTALGPWTGVGQSTVQHLAGLASFGGTLTYTPASPADAGTGTVSELFVLPPAGTGPVGGNVVTFHLFLPATAAGVVAWAQPYVQDGSAAQTFSGAYTAATALKFGDWTTITLPLPIALVSPIFKIAVQIFTTGAAPFSGGIYVDSIGW